MMTNETILTKQETKWIIEKRVTRLTDNKEVQIYPMGAERHLSSVLLANKKTQYNLKDDVEGKRVLIIPGYGMSGFILAQAGANSVIAYDKDPVTIAWMKAFKKYYYYRDLNNNPSIEDLFKALISWYPPLLGGVNGRVSNFLLWLLSPNSLRRRYIHHMLYLVRHAIQMKTKENFELDKTLEFHSGTITNVINQHEAYDTAYIPYLLGVKNGIEKDQDIIYFMRKLLHIIPEGRILVTPSQSKKEFYVFGKQYLETLVEEHIQDISELKPFFIVEDKHWFRTQGLAVFGQTTPTSI